MSGWKPARPRPIDARHDPRPEARERERYARRSPQLNVIPEGWRPLPGVPSSREACRNGPRPCPYVRCRYHLWLKLSQDRDGRPSDGVRRQAPSTLWPTSPTTCALDVADSGKLRDFRELGDMLGVTDEGVRRIFIRALAKLRAQGIDLEKGIDLRSCAEDATDHKVFADGCGRGTARAHLQAAVAL